jgi:hypothetical protein
MSLADIAELIERDADRLVAAWAEAVRGDQSIKSDADLTEGGLVNHVPYLVEEICQVLRAGERPRVENTREARVHAYTRFRQGYRARDLVRETSLLRAILFDHVSDSLSAGGDGHDPRPHLQALRTINLYIDEELRYAVSIYTESQ